MKIHSIVFLLCVVAFSKKCESQNVDSSTLSKMINHGYLNYKDKQGNWIDAKPLETGSVKVVFYSFLLDKAARTAKIEGRVIDPSTIGDGMGVINYIFLATPIKNKLTRIRTLGLTCKGRTNASNEDKFPFRIGDFKAEFKFNDIDRLYFNSEMTSPVEYNIGTLLKNDE